MTYSNAFFVSENWIKNNTPITSNVDIQEIYPFVGLAQDIYMGQKIGTPLYERLKDGLINSNLTQDETNLISVFRPSIAYYIALEALPFISDKIRNIGVVETADTKQTTTDLERLRRLENKLKNSAEFYMTKVDEYLCKNGNLFPLLEGCHGCNDKARTYTCDLYLDNDDYIDRDWIRRNYYY